MGIKTTGWHSDPYGLHQSRYFSLDGNPTRLVSNDGTRSFDDAPGPPRVAGASVRSKPDPQPSVTDAHWSMDRMTGFGANSPLLATATLSPHRRRGWHPDPYGVHEARYFSQDGNPTRLVSDAGRTSHDDVTPRTESGSLLDRRYVTTRGTRRDSF